MIGTDDETGCENSAEIEVTVHASPEVVANASDTEICLGEEITLTGSGATEYVWGPDSVEDGVAFEHDMTGTYTYSVQGIDDNGCANTDEVEINVYEAIEITFTTTDEMLGGDGGIDITVTGGNPDYSFDWDNDETGDFDDTEDLTDLEAGTYEVVVEDEAGCTGTISIVVDSQVGLVSFEKTAVKAYPNPTNANVQIQVEGNFDYQILSLSGEILTSGTGFNTQTISLVEYANGTYIVHLSTDTNVADIRVVKK